MPWYNGDYPPSYKNQPVLLRNKAVEIANSLLADGAEEGAAIATGLKRARQFFKNKSKTMDDKEQKVKTESSGEAAAKRGKEAIEANRELNEKGKSKEQVQKDEEKDAEKWRNEG